MPIIKAKCICHVINQSYKQFPLSLQWSHVQLFFYIQQPHRFDYFFYILTSLSLNLFYFSTNCQKNKILWNPSAVSCGWDNRCYRPVALIFGECLTAWWEFHFDLCLFHLGGPSSPWKVWTDSCCIYKAKSLFWILGFNFWGKYNLGIKITASQALGSGLCVCLHITHLMLFV